MPIVVGSLHGKLDRPAQQALEQLVAYANALEAHAARLSRQVAALPTPLTLDEIRQGLSATGAAPLNVTGLPGLPPSAGTGV